MKHPILKKVNLLTLGNHTYRCTYYRGVNEFGFGKHMKKCLNYLNVKKRRDTVGIGYIESIKGDIFDNQSRVNLVYKELIGSCPSYDNVLIYTGEIENSIKCIIIKRRDRNDIESVYLSEDSFTNEQIKEL